MKRETIWKNLYKTDMTMLMYLASSSNLYKGLKTSTIKIAKELNISQQSVSRKLTKLEKQEFIKRIITNKGITITITQKVLNLIKNISKHLEDSIYSDIIIKGNVIKGLGEGKYYMSKEGYKKSFKESIGYLPWSGTLNIKLKSEITKDLFSIRDKIKIKGFREKNRSFGDISCYNCNILNNKGSKQNLKTHIIIPERTSHKDNIIEIISPVHLRKKLSIKDNDEIKITLA